MTQERKETYESEVQVQDETEVKTKSEITRKREYNKIPKDIRKQLLETIEEGQLTIKAAAQQLGINYSSAKNIVKIFRQQERIDVMIKTSGRRVVSKMLKKDKTLKRFTAKRTHLAVNSQFHNSNAIPNKTSTVKYSPETIKENKLEPCFDFAVYAPLIYNRYALTYKYSIVTCRGFGRVLAKTE